MGAEGTCMGTSIDRRRAAKVSTLLREQYGRLAVAAGRDVAVHLPGPHPYAVQVTVERRRVVVRCPVAVALEWSTKGLADFLLRENGSLPWTRLVREDEMLVMEHVAFAEGITGEQLALAVDHVAAGAQRTGETLRRAGVGAGDWP
jgi:hypothetical protein